DETRVDHFADDAFRPQIKSALEGFVSAEALVMVDARRIGLANAAEQAKLRLTGLGNGELRVQNIGRGWQAAVDGIADQCLEGAGSGRSKYGFARFFARCGD